MSKWLKGIFARKKTAANIQRDFYTMAAVNGDEAEITMYGEIVQERPRDWWSGEEIEGDFIVLDEFLEDLKTIADAKRITIRLNSVGGDAYAAIPIHNRLRELKANVTVIVDGVAMSGGSLIMCAADTVRVNPSSLIMIHKCWLFLFGGYNADELREIAASNDAVDKAQAAIYMRKTGLDEETILSMMADTTYMTGAEAVDKGFADELTDAEKPEIAASADMRTLYVNGRAMHLLNPLSGLPESIPTVKTAEADQTHTKQPATTGGQEGGPLMAKNLEELRTENPELANQIMAEAQAAASKDAGAAVNAERQRILDIDAISALFDDETVREAKYGEKACTAQEMAFRAAQKAAKNGTAFMEAANKDYKASGAAAVGAASPGIEEPAGDKTPNQRMAEARAGVKALLGKKEEK